LHILSFIAPGGSVGREQARIFADDAVLIETIEHVTHGHALNLALAAETALEARAHGQVLQLGDCEFALLRVFLPALDNTGRQKRWNYPTFRSMIDSFSENW